jgi:hypothetical protein
VRYGLSNVVRVTPRKAVLRGRLSNPSFAAAEAVDAYARREQPDDSEYACGPRYYGNLAICIAGLSNSTSAPELQDPVDQSPRLRPPHPQPSSR